MLAESELAVVLRLRLAEAAVPVVVEVSQPLSWSAQLKWRSLKLAVAGVGAIWAGIAVAARADWAAWASWG